MQRECTAQLTCDIQNLGSLPSDRPPPRAPTVLLVEVDLGLVLLPALEGLLHLVGHVLAGVGAVQEAAAAVLLHDLGPGEAGEFAEGVGAVDDGVAAVALGVTQQEITVCGKDTERFSEGTKHHGGRKKNGDERKFNANMRRLLSFFTLRFVAILIIGLKSKSV